MPKASYLSVVTALGILSAFAFSMHACTNEVVEPEPICDPGETQPCICGMDLHGGQACDEDGMGWGPCTCGDDDDDDDAADDDDIGDDDDADDDDADDDDDNAGDDDDAEGPDIRVEPPQIVMDVEVLAYASRDLRIYNDGSAELIVASMSQLIGTGGISVYTWTGSIPAGGYQDLSPAVEASCHTSGLLQDTLRIVSNDANENPLDLSILADCYEP